MSVARFIADQRTKYQVPHVLVCALLGVSLAWFYKWWGRAQLTGRVQWPAHRAGPASRHDRPGRDGRLRQGPWAARLAAAAARPARRGLDGQ